MRASIISAALAAVGVSARPQEIPAAKVVPALPVNIFDTPRLVVPVPFQAAHEKFEAANVTGAQGPDLLGLLTTRATCGNVRVRPEWDSYSNDRRQGFVNGIKCLMGRSPSGQFGNSRSRYEDLVALHQTLTPNVHGNAKFLLWHRYLLWTFEDMLRQECGFSDSIPWFDETKYAGRFSQSSIFSSQWFGGIGLGGNCVRDGQFANLAINVGPGTGNQVHCLARNGDGSKTSNCNSAYVNQCNSWADFANMASCSEGGPHAWGHNGIGAVMQDVYASPADPVFWLHHAFIDRNFRIWQNANGDRVNSINGNDIRGNPLNLDTSINVYGIRPDVRIRDILDTTATTLCYRYNY
ncbi:Di-copper centre-containing protein [Plenodomus tracheiphilus IPT5]|uniref:Di-copper centre-containing protein n=1 Tax=Plenodomus tracheiphilus IPT5 TaxID=1408161 RepID=A0A6A7BCJ9_9PLEO|nr:Di-copper centre-containing protein [Plenodomus tracheiphilus IPT5]